MTTLKFMIAIAIKNLRRGGQRVFVALLCIAFGVMSLVAMTMLSQALERMLVIEPALLVGADVTMDRLYEDVILPEHEAELQALQREGIIDRYTLIAYSSTMTFRLPGSGELHFPSAGIGIDPAVYPLVGSFTVANPSNVGIETLLQEPGDILLTKDLAMEYQLQEGDRLILANLEVGRPLEATIRAIVTDTPNHQGSKIYYNLATAEILADGQPMLNTAHLTAPDPQAARDRLAASGWRPYLATQLALGDKNVQQMFELLLKGAGILGLLVGGIGIANTMQVILRRRRREVAIWKTLGYQEGQLQMIFAVEAALLGGAGSLAGAIAGIVLSYSLVDLFSRISIYLISWSFSAETVISGIVVGALTAILFSMVAIVSACRVQPVTLLRNEPVVQTRQEGLRSIIMLALVGLPFAAITSLVMGSAIKGIGVLLAALVGLLMLGGFLSVIKWAAVRFLPLGSLPLVSMARNNLKRRGASLIFAMIALFIGVVSLSLGGMITLNAQQVLERQAVTYEGDNLAIIAPAAQEERVRQAIEAQAVNSYSPGYLTPIRSARLNDEQNSSLPAMIVAREKPDQYRINGAPWGSRPDGVYIFQNFPVEEGSTVELTLWDGTRHILPVVGSYFINEQAIQLNVTSGILMPNELSQRLVPPERIQYFVNVPARRLQSVSAALGAALPETTVINLVAYSARFSQAYSNLFIFAAAMAGLALLAGMLLIANSVSIAMIDRRYEIGVLKTIGYRRRHVLLTLVVEYGLVAVIATIAGLGLVHAFVAMVVLMNPIAALIFNVPLPASLMIGGICVGLTLLTVVMVTLEPTRVSPIVVLNDRE